jgi:hypothetical protein
MIENSIFKVNNYLVSSDTISGQKNALTFASDPLLTTSNTSQPLVTATTEITNFEPLIRSTDLMSGAMNPVNNSVIDPLTGKSFQQQTAAMAGDSLLAGGDLQTVAAQVLSEQGSSLQKTFTSADEWQHFLSDVFATNPKFQNLSPDQLVAMRDGFTSGSLRPEIKFVTPDVLVDAQGQTRSAAFDDSTNTILLASNLDRASIADGIRHELGHWWDTQLNGTTDTIAKDGQAFDEGEAYAERFGTGVMPIPGSSTSSDFHFSSGVYQDDHSQVYLDGKETPVEFRPIATWNLNGATRTQLEVASNGTLTNVTRNSWEDVFNVMNNPGQGQDPIDVMSIQEGGEPESTDLPGRSDVSLINDDSVNIAKFTIERGGANFTVFSAHTSIAATSRNDLAIVVRNPLPTATLEPFYVRNPNNSNGVILGNDRGALGLEFGDNFYFSIHARSSLGGGANLSNDAEQLVYAAEGTANNRQAGIGPFRRNFTNVLKDKFFLGDFNRDGNFTNTPFPTLTNGTANNVGYRVINPNDNTYDARGSGRLSKLDYLIRNQGFNSDLLSSQPLPDGIVLNQLPNANTSFFPSDHFPVVFDDGEESSRTNASSTFVGDELAVYSSPGISVGSGSIEGFGSGVQLAAGKLPTDIVGVVQTSNSYTEVYYLDGTATRTQVLSDLTEQKGEEFKYDLAEGKTPENIVGIDNLDKFDSAIYYYDDGTASIKNIALSYTLPSGKTPKDILEVAITKIESSPGFNDKNDTFTITFYKDGSYSRGDLLNLGKYERSATLSSFASSNDAASLVGASVDLSGRLNLFKLI